MTKRERRRETGTIKVKREKMDLKREGSSLRFSGYSFTLARACLKPGSEFPNINAEVFDAGG